MEKSITIGVILPLTGSAAHLGNWALQGLQIAQNDINHKGGIDGKQIIFFIEDDHCEGLQAITAFKKLIVVDKVQFIIGPLCNAASIPIAPLAETNKIVTITLGVS